MIDSLHVSNYRNLKELTISTLGRVNLIVGKNNTGKSTLLEAVALFVNKGNIGLISELLEERGENYASTKDERNYLANNIKTFTSIFTNRDEEHKNSNTAHFISQFSGKSETLSLNLVPYIYDFLPDSEGKSGKSSLRILDTQGEDQFPNYRIGFQIKFEKNEKLFSLMKN